MLVELIFILNKSVFGVIIINFFLTKNKKFSLEFYFTILFLSIYDQKLFLFPLHQLKILSKRNASFYSIVFAVLI